MVPLSSRWVGPAASSKLLQAGRHEARGSCAVHCASTHLLALRLCDPAPISSSRACSLELKSAISTCGSPCSATVPRLVISTILSAY